MSRILLEQLGAAALGALAAAARRAADAAAQCVLDDVRAAAARAVERIPTSVRFQPPPPPPRRIRVRARTVK